MLTVLFATYNGARTLPMMLDSMVRMDWPDAWELIAVDNASTDATAEILESFKSQLPLRVLREDRQGKNYALNTGLEYARGELIVLTDDDVIVEKDWLQRMEACAACHLEYDVFGGQILPHWSAQPDPVVLENAPLGVTYALTPDDQVSGPVFPGLVWGPNMAVRKSVFDRGHRFNESVGPSSGNYVMGSETEFTIRVHDAGHKSWYCDASRVRHVIREHQLRREWVIRRAYRFGRNQWMQESRESFGVPCVCGIPRWRFAAFAEECINFVHSVLKRDRSARFRSSWEIHFLKGYLTQAVLSKITSKNGS